jgi:hypothetical protein
MHHGASASHTSVCSWRLQLAQSRHIAATPERAGSSGKMTYRRLRRFSAWRARAPRTAAEPGLCGLDGINNHITSTDDNKEKKSDAIPHVSRL